MSHPDTSASPSPDIDVSANIATVQTAPPPQRLRPPHRHAGARIREFLENETRSGMLLLAAAVLAILWANSPFRDSYHQMAGTYLGPESLGLKMSVAHWAADGLLAIFFFIVGLELKTEFVTGQLRDAKRAALPMICAVLGMVVPALLYSFVQQMTNSGLGNGWAIPAATDIAFAVALLGIFGKGLPPGVRVFLLTLAVVDDLLAITVIAVFYTDRVDFVALGLSFLVIAAFAVLVQRRVTSWWILIPLALIAWVFMFRSGVHATVAGVLLGMVVPAKMRGNEDDSMTHRFVHAIHPISAGFALPVFAFFAAGVTVTGGIGQMLTNPAAIGVIAGLVLGKFIGIYGGVVFFARFTPLKPGGGVNVADLLGVSFLAGIGFTVSLLISELSFPGDPAVDAAKFGVMVASLLAGMLGAFFLTRRRKQLSRGGDSGRGKPHTTGRFGRHTGRVRRKAAAIRTRKRRAPRFS